MTDYGPVLIKLVSMRPRRVYYNFDSAMVIPEDAIFTKEEIEDLRNEDADYVWATGNHLIANFMPDDIRPADVPKM